MKDGALGAGRLRYGADYNPEQWPREVWREDMRLMQQAGVNIVSLGIFSWALLEPRPGEWDFGWLDEVMDLLHESGIDVDLATATASPPPWLSRLHPEVLPVTDDGTVLHAGGRQHWRPTSPIFRFYALRLVRKIAERYADHPALVAWHISNELGCHNVFDYSDDAARAFRGWLQDRYATLDELNDAWGTAFWSQHYGDWEEIVPPRVAPTHVNPGRQLDFERFSSDALRDYLRAENAVLAEVTPSVPRTTNFMVTEVFPSIDYATWVDDVDFVSNDHYLRPGAGGREELSFSANLTGNLALGRPVVPDGARDERGELARREHRQARGRAVAGRAHPRRPRRRRRLLLPVAPVARRRRAVPLGDGPARRRGQPGLPRCRGARPHARRARPA